MIDRRGIALGVVLALGLASPARAQSRTGFAVDRFEPSESGATWFVVDALDFRGDARPAFGVNLDYAYKPLAVYDSSGALRLALVRHQLFADLGASVILRDRFRLAIAVPLAIYQDGDDAVVAGESLKAATAPAFGDVRLAADVRIIGRYADPFSLAVGVRGWLPTGSRSQFTSDGSTRVGPEILASGSIGVIAWAARTALVYRSRDDAYAGSSLGSELSGSVGAGARIGKLLLGPEVFASTVLADAFSASGTPVDAILGGHWRAGDFTIGVGAGSGLTRGYGSPAFRALASLEWSPSILEAAPKVTVETPEEMPQEDTDGDGIWDRDDACPAQAGVRTGDARTNGCPSAAISPPLAVVTDTEIRIEEQIQFATDRAELVGDSDHVLAAVKAILAEHPEIRRLRVEGHTDDTGDAAYNDDLSRRRAATVTRWLVDHGIAAERLVSEGFGATKPIDTNETEAGRARNRRVVFTIVERAPAP